MKAVNSTTLSITGALKREIKQLGDFSGPIDFVIVKIGNFDVVLWMKFML